MRIYNRDSLWFGGGSLGVAILECAILLTLLLLFALGGFVVFERVQSSEELAQIVDDVLLDSAIKPLELLSVSGGLQVRPRSAELKSFLGAVAREIEHRVKNSVIGDSKVSEGFIIEAAYAELGIDEQSGRPIGLSQSPFSDSFIITRGSVPAIAERKCRLETVFEPLAQSLLGDSRVESSYALPSGLFGDPNSNRRFIGSSIIVGVCLNLKSARQGMLNFMPPASGSEVTSISKVVMLRGAID